MIFGGIHLATKHYQIIFWNVNGWIMKTLLKMFTFLITPFHPLILLLKIYHIGCFALLWHFSKCNHWSVKIKSARLCSNSIKKGYHRLFSLALYKVQNICVLPISIFICPSPLSAKWKIIWLKTKNFGPLWRPQGQKPKWLRIIQFGKKSHKKLSHNKKAT